MNKHQVAASIGWTESEYDAWLASGGIEDGHSCIPADACFCTDNTWPHPVDRPTTRHRAFVQEQRAAIALALGLSEDIRRALTGKH